MLLLTQDSTLADTLPSELAQYYPEIEVQTLRSVESLREHLRRLHPDSIVLDVSSVNVQLASLLAEPRFASLPVIVLDAPQGRRKMWALDCGAAAYVTQASQYPRLLAEKLRRLQRLPGRVQETVHHYRSILDASGDAIFVLIGEELRYVNPSLENMVGAAAGALTTRTGFLSYVVPEERRILAEALARLHACDDDRALLEVTLVTPEGRRVLEMSCRSSVLDGQRAVIGIARDVTSIRRLEDEIAMTRQRAAQAERLRALGELAAGVAHDFNNVLGSIIGHADLALGRAQKGESIRGDLETIRRAASNAVRVVKRIQTFAKPSEQDPWEDVTLGLVIEDAADFARPRVREGVLLELCVADTPPVKGNSDELREVVLNLLNNAIDAVGEHGHVQVSCHEEDGCGVITVQDNGSGIPEDVQAKIFEPFFSTKKEHGTGLAQCMSLDHSPSQCANRCRERWV
ncbi:MAG: ATP-binding protein [Myxococcota bacterium]